MSNSISRFLGDTPGRVIVRLLILSFIVGLVMTTIGWSVRDLYNGIVRFVSRIWDLGFDLVLNSVEYIVVGAVIVVPLFLVMRILNLRSR